MIRNAKDADVESLLAIYASAKEFMRRSGNPNQWNGNYPDTDTLYDDIQKGNLFVIEDGEIFGCFALIGGDDPTYAHIDGGAWMADTPYGTIHRIASDGTRKGVFSAAVEFARGQYRHLRIDTHKDNFPMQQAILREGFSYRGIIYLENGDPRNAYEWVE